eukprot:scaffold19360_cov59-Cyclotella_meneghiniana.AAC.5
MVQTPRPCVGLDIGHIWDEEAECMFGCDGMNDDNDSSSGGKRNKKKQQQPQPRVKRKASSMEDSSKMMEEESVRSGSSSVVGKQRGGSYEEERFDDAKNSLPLCGLEEDERMLSFLQSSHRGDFSRAKLSAMVNIDRGYGK